MQTRTYAIGAAFLTAALLGGLGSFVLMNGRVDRTAECGANRIAGELGGPFELVDPSGRTVTDKDIITKPSLVYFGYTFCPDFCPMDSARNADAVDLLAERGIDVQAVFITVDPKRDTPEVVGGFVENFSDSMIGLTGSQEQVNAAKKAYRAVGQVNNEDPEYYTVNHSLFTYLVQPGSKVTTYFDTNTLIDSETVADKVACLLDGS